MSKIVLFTYPGSPWGAKVTNYLALRGIEYFECHQPMTWPRPDLDLLNVRYRRIPFLAIGKDIYYDSLLIFEKLEALSPESALGAKECSARALEKLMEKWAEGTLLKSVLCLLPKNLPFLTDSKFLSDREELWGMNFSPEALEKGLSKSLVEVREQFAFLENLLKDGRSWLLDTEKAGLIDIHGKKKILPFNIANHGVG
jgi:glutathione S-transferase